MDDDALTAFWEEAGLEDDPDDVGWFGDTPAMADDLAGLVLAGRKRGTASMVEAHLGQPPPAVGMRELILDGSQRPVCIIEITGVERSRFDEVTAEFAAREGEGDGSLAHWRAEHGEFFRRQARELGIEFSGDSEIYLVSFDVIHPTVR